MTAIRKLLFAMSLIASAIAHAQEAAPEWRAIDPANTLYMDLNSGRIVIELAPQFAPNHVDNIKTLVREGYFDGQRINRVQDNFVAQWGDPMGAKPFKQAKRRLFPEFIRPTEGLSFTPMPDSDTYAPQTGFVDGFPAARLVPR